MFVPMTTAILNYSEVLYNNCKVIQLVHTNTPTIDGDDGNINRTNIINFIEDFCKLDEISPDNYIKLFNDNFIPITYEEFINF